mgnify:CR=1 FL=1
MAVLLSYFYLPCNSNNCIPNFNLRNTSNKYLTYLQVDTNITIFYLLCDFKKENNMSIFSSIGVTI